MKLLNTHTNILYLTYLLTYLFTTFIIQNNGEIFKVNTEKETEQIKNLLI